MRGNRKAPVSDVTATSGWMSDAPLNVIVAPGSTAPVLSVALPKISPVLTCAAAPDATINRQTNIPIDVANLLIHPPGDLRLHACHADACEGGSCKGEQRALLGPKGKGLSGSNQALCHQLYGWGRAAHRPVSGV